MSHGPGGERLGHIVWHLVPALALSLLLLKLNLFGSLTALERYGQVLFTQVFSPILYTQLPPHRTEPSLLSAGTAHEPAACPRTPPGQGCRDQTAVLLVGDNDLQQLGWSWPITYTQHAKILGQLREHRPRALMIDFLFLDERKDTTADLLTELNEYRRLGIPVFLASPPVKSGSPPVRDVFAEAQTGMTHVPVPRAIGGERDETYPLFFNFNREKEPRRTAAHAIYDHFCPPTAPAGFCGGRVAEIKKPERSDDRIEGHADDGPTLELFWGTRPWNVSAPAAQLIKCDQSTGKGATVVTNGLARITIAITEVPVLGGVARWIAEAGAFIVRLFSVARYGDHLRAECPFTPTVYAAQIIVGGVDTDLHKLVGAVVHDRVVFYSAALEGLGDVLRVPGHVPLPGVYAHAMAYDNLLTFGADYKREEILLAETRLARWAPGWLRQGRIARWAHEYALTPRVCHYISVTIIQVPILGYVLWRRQRRGVTESTKWRQLRGWLEHLLTYAVLSILFVLSFAWFQFAWLDLTVGNWLEPLVDAFVGRHVAELAIEAITR